MENKELLDAFFARCESLQGPPYNYAGGRSGESLALAQQRGVDCSGMIDVSLRDMGLREFGGTARLASSLMGRQPYRSDGWYLRGTVLVNDDVGADWDNSHAAVVSDAENQLVVHSRRPDGVVSHEHHAETNKLANYKWAGYLLPLGVDLDPHYFPGWFAPPELLAIYMSTVARDEFGLPEVLPVMCSMAELPDAWVPGPLAFHEIPGYSHTVNDGPLGFFQQDPGAGWGSREQIMDPDYALRAFCRRATDMRPHQEPQGAAELGEWCASVQHPAGQSRYLYAPHYSRALTLIEHGRRLVTPYHVENYGLTFAEINFAAAGHRDQIAAYIAAVALANVGVKSFVATEDNIQTMVTKLWPVPVGLYRIIVVGKAAFDLLPEDHTQYVYYPPRLEKSDYCEAVGQDYAETVGRLAVVLEEVSPGVGQDFLNRMAIKV
jgi:hypothetical protein